LTEDELWASVRYLRNRKLAESDWTQMPDAPLTEQEKADFTVYRQALRDVPQVAETLVEAVLPSEPELEAKH